MKGLYQRHHTWWFRFSYDGKQHRITTGESDESRAIIRAREIQMNPDEWLGISTGIKVDIEAFVAEKKKRGISPTWAGIVDMILESFTRDYEITSPRGIIPQKVSDWLDTFENPNTAFQRWTVLNQFCKWLCDRNKINSNPCADVLRPKKAERVRRRFLSQVECNNIIEACECPELRLVIQFGIYAGMRKGEILQVRPNWLDLNRDLIHVTGSKEWKPKRDKNRTIPLATPLKAAIGDDLRLPFIVAPDRNNDGLYRWEFRDAFNGLKKRAGMNDIVFHDLRRTFASLHVSAGTSIYKVAKWLGDRVDTTEKHYGHLQDSDEDINNAWESSNF